MRFNVQRSAHAVAEQIDVRDRRLNAAAVVVLTLREELREAHEERIARGIAAGRFRAEHRAEHERMLPGMAIYGNAVSGKDHEFQMELDAVERPSQIHCVARAVEEYFPYSK